MALCGPPTVHQVQNREAFLVLEVALGFLTICAKMPVLRTGQRVMRMNRAKVPSHCSAGSEDIRFRPISVPSRLVSKSAGHVLLIVIPCLRWSAAVSSAYDISSNCSLRLSRGPHFHMSSLVVSMSKMQTEIYGPGVLTILSSMQANALHTIPCS